MNELIKLLTTNEINYSDVINNCYIKLFDNEEMDINFIIPVKNRKSFAIPMYDSFLKAKSNSNLKISYTVVEISNDNEHQEFCETNKINYVWYKTDNVLFNKCLGLNIGALYTVKTKSLLFHDIDCLIQSDFFIKLEENIKNKNAKAIQCFHGRRVLYLNDYLTNMVINKNIDIDTFKLGNDGISLPQYIGAPGGSIFINKDLFLNVGGFEPELFLANAPEDAFFWEKVDTISKMYVCDEPNIDIFHMNHPPTYNSNPYMHSMIAVYNAFKNYDLNNKLLYIKTKSEKLKSISNGE
jgi:predicted glycosyltransferase involved in capsule biosynthesis